MLRSLGYRLLNRFRPVSEFRAGELTVFMYHGVVASKLPIENLCFLEAFEFQDQLKALRKRCEIVPLEEGLDTMFQGRLKKPAVALTFDDGYYNNYEVAFPILSEFSIPATIFLTTGYVDTADVPWVDRLQHQLTVTTERKLIWEGKTYRLGSWRRRAAALHHLAELLKQRPHPGPCKDVDRIRARLGIRDRTAFGLDSPFRILTRSAIGEMAASGLVSFGAHTVHHAILSRLSGAAARSEIVDSIDEVAALTGQPCRLFAYPNGTPLDYDETALEVLRETTVKWAFTTRVGVNSTTTPPLELRRLAPANPRRIVRKWGPAADRKLAEARWKPLA